MTRCPACGRRYDDAARFCAFDGTALVAVGTSVESETDGASRGLPSAAGPTPASRALGDLLGRAGTPAASGGHPPSVDSLHGPPRSLDPRPTSDTRIEREADAGDDDMEADAAPRRSRAVWIAVVAALLLGGAVGAYLLQGPRALEREANDAIARGDLVTPARVSAYDFARRLAERYPRSGAAERVGVAAFPRLIAAMDDFYARFYRTSEANRAEWARTQRLAEWATAIAPQDAHVRARAEYARGRVAALDGDRSAARTAYERAAAAWPEWALPPNSLGVLLGQTGDADGAEARYRQAADLDPAWPFPLANLGALYLRQERFDDAADALGRAVSADPERPAPHALLARAYAGQDRYDEAIDEATEALRLDPTGAAGFDARSLRAAVQEWQSALEADEAADEGGLDWMEERMDEIMDDTTGL